MNRIVVGIGEIKLATAPDDVLITFALGSCLGLTIYDPVVRIGGMIHIALPDSAIAAGKEDFLPGKFVDTGIPHLFKESYKLGAQKSRLIVKMAGCSQIADDIGFFNIGKRNYAAARKLLWKNNVLIEAEHCGESFSRTMSLDIASGRVTIRINGEDFPL